MPRGQADELWVGPAQVRYGASGQIRGSLAHLPGGVCAQHGENPDTTGLYEGWGRILGAPTALGDLLNGTPVTATDSAGLIAVGLCPACRALIG